MNAHPFLAVVAAWASLALAVALILAFTPAPFGFAVAASAIVAGILGRRPIADAVNAVWLRKGTVVEPGHYIRVEGVGDVEGYVDRIGWRHTTLQTQAGDEVRIPNTTLANSIFTNFHLVDRRDVLIDIDADAAVEPQRITTVLGQEAQTAAHTVPGLVPGSQRIVTLPGRFPGCRRYLMQCKVRDPVDRDLLNEELERRIRTRLRRDRIPIATLTPPKTDL